MSRPGWPIFCAYGAAHAAAYRVATALREVVTCAEHLGRARKWAGPGSSTDPLPGHGPPPDEPAQQTLF